MKNTLKSIVGRLLTVITLAFSTAAFAQTNIAATTAKTTAVGTTKNWGSVDGISMIGLVQGPSSADTQLQVACIFFKMNVNHSSMLKRKTYL